MWVSAALRAAETHLLRMVQDLRYLNIFKELRRIKRGTTP
jgi:hypothetical protein